MEEEEIVVAFSGGLDSSLVLWAVVRALGRKRVRAVHVDWGPYSYSQLRSQVLAFTSDCGLEPIFLDGRARLEQVLKGGPACNRCTRQAKLGLLRQDFPTALILTGANRSDSWGQRGEPLMNRVLAPLFSLGKAEIHTMVNEAGLVVRPIGESTQREGCKAKHLLKPLVAPSFHGRTVAVANEQLMDVLAARRFRSELANVKIYGPLGENHALVNVRPWLSEVEEVDLRGRLVLSGLPLASVRVARHPLELTVVASPALIGDAHARLAVEEGILARGFAVPIEVCWLRSVNTRLLSFHVVEAIGVDS